MSLLEIMVEYVEQQPTTTTNHQPPTINHHQPTTNNQPPATNQQPTTNNQQHIIGMFAIYMRIQVMFRCI